MLMIASRARRIKPVRVILPKRVLLSYILFDQHAVSWEVMSSVRCGTLRLTIASSGWEESMRYLTQLVGPVVLLILLLPGCVAPGTMLPTSTPSVGVPFPGQTSVSPETASFPVDSLRVCLEFPARVALGRPVPFTLHVHNPTARSITALIPGRPVPKAFELIITTSGGVEVWRMMRHRDWAASRHTFAPGEVLILRDFWDQTTNDGKPVQPGTYSVYASLSDGPSTAPRPLVITR